MGKNFTSFIYLRILEGIRKENIQFIEEHKKILLHVLNAFYPNQIF
jgi:hypothetical protein